MGAYDEIVNDEPIIILKLLCTFVDRKLNRSNSALFS